MLIFFRKIKNGNYQWPLAPPPPDDPPPKLLEWLKELLDELPDEEKSLELLLLPE
jgi:hypothetical protein